MARSFRGAPVFPTANAVTAAALLAERPRRGAQTLGTVEIDDAEFTVVVLVEATTTAGLARAAGDTSSATWKAMMPSPARANPPPASQPSRRLTAPRFRGSGGGRRADRSKPIGPQWRQTGSGNRGARW